MVEGIDVREVRSSKVSQHLQPIFYFASFQDENQVHPFVEYTAHCSASSCPPAYCSCVGCARARFEYVYWIDEVSAGRGQENIGFSDFYQIHPSIIPISCLSCLYFVFRRHAVYSFVK